MGRGRETDLREDDEEDGDFPDAARREGGGTADEGESEHKLEDAEGELASPHALRRDVGRGRFDCVRHVAGWTVLKLGGRLGRCRRVGVIAERVTVHDWKLCCTGTGRKETRGRQAEYVLGFGKAVSQLF